VILLDKIQFNNLMIMDQLNYINTKLKNDTLRTICEEIKIGRTTVRDRLTKNGYIFDKDLKQYIKNSEYKRNTTICEVAVTSSKQEVPRSEYKPTTNIFNTKEAKNKMLDLLEKHNDIEEMLKWYHDQKNIIEVDLNELKINGDKLVGDVKITTVRLYSEVWEHFREFIEENKQFKSMDLISMAMVEYMDRYKK